jgi:hypothetical protein
MHGGDLMSCKVLTQLKNCGYQCIDCFFRIFVSFHQPPGTGNRLPESVCILSPLCEIVLYSQLLNAVEEKLRFPGGTAKTAHDLLRSAYELPCPMPNCEVQIPFGVSLHYVFYA